MGTNSTNGINWIDEPLNEDELKRAEDSQGVVEVVVGVDLTEIAEMDYEGFLDMLETAVCGGSALLTDIAYSVAGADPSSGLVLVRVSGIPDYYF